MCCMRDQYTQSILTNRNIYQKVSYRLQVNKHFLTMSFTQCRLCNGQSYQCGVAYESDKAFIILRLLLRASRSVTSVYRVHTRRV